MLVTASRLHAVRYFFEIKRYIEERGYNDLDVLIAFSGEVHDDGNSFTESNMNKTKDGKKISESQTKEYFNSDDFNILVTFSHNISDSPSEYNLTVWWVGRGVLSTLEVHGTTNILLENWLLVLLDTITTGLCLLFLASFHTPSGIVAQYMKPLAYLDIIYFFSF